LTNDAFLLVRSPESGYPDGISGIINHADVDKLPVRLLLFAQITEIESRLREMVLDLPWQTDPIFANTARQASNMRKAHRNEALSLMNYLNFAQLGRIAHHYKIFHISMDSEKVFARLQQLKDIRNAVAHGNEIQRRPDPLMSVKASREALSIVDEFLALTRSSRRIISTN